MFTSRMFEKQWMSGEIHMFMLSPEMMAAYKHTGFHLFHISISPPPPPIKKEIYINLVYLISMVIVPFTLSAWFLWCTELSIPRVDGCPLTGKTYAKINGWVFQHPFRKHRYPPKKLQTTTINTQVNTWILCHYFHVYVCVFVCTIAHKDLNASILMMIDLFNIGLFDMDRWVNTDVTNHIN